MALHERRVLDRRDGNIVTNDLASYHVATTADVPAIEVSWIDEVDPHVNPLGSKGIGEIGTVAAIANAVYDATGVRVRDLPVTVDRCWAERSSPAGRERLEHECAVRPQRPGIEVEVAPLPCTVVDRDASN